MYLRTPKRYQRQRRQAIISLRWLWLWILTPVIAFAGWHIYEHRDQYAPPVRQMIQSMANRATDGIATVTAPTPLPTQNPTDRLRLADDAWAQGAIDEALANYMAVLDNVPNDVEVYYRVTWGLLMNGRNREALDIAERTVTANPFSSDAWAIRSAALNANDRYGEAIASALQALNITRSSARATAFLAEAYLDSNQPQRALETANKAVEMDPNSFEAYYAVGRVHQESTYDFDAALEAFQTAYDLAPNMPTIGVAMAWLNVAQEDYDAGMDMLQNIVELNPQNVDALYALGRFSYTAYGDPNQALDYLSRCVAASPQNIPCNYYMGTVKYGMGDNQGAAEAFMKVIDLGTTNPRHYLSAGNINVTLGNCAAAIPYFQQGYKMENALPTPNYDNLIGFEDGLRRCRAPGFEGFAEEVTPEATEEAS